MLGGEGTKSPAASGLLCCSHCRPNCQSRHDVDSMWLPQSPSWCTWLEVELVLFMGVIVGIWRASTFLCEEASMQTCQDLTVVALSAAGSGRVLDGSLHAYHIAEAAWTDLSMTTIGNPPTARSGMGAASFGGKLYMFGGISDCPALLHCTPISLPSPL